jgi:hypothetical protein
MNPIEFLKTIYLGDRACKKILIDGWNRRFYMQVDCISRLEKGTHSWNYYNREDIENGWLVFSEVKGLGFKPDGFIPNDYINGIDVKQSGNEFIFEISVGAGVNDGETVEVLIYFSAAAVTVQSNDELLKKTMLGIS